MRRNNALLIMVKDPVPGAVKSRLQPDLSPVEAAVLYKAMVEDMVGELCALSVCDIHVLCWPAESEKRIQRWLGHQVHCEPQFGADIGERMMNGFKQTFVLQYQRVITIGSDIPLIKQYQIQEAFTRLNDHDLVLGPCPDGGYYLLGVTEPRPELFQDIEWSTPSVLHQTRHIAQQHDLIMCELREERDIDTYADVLHLWSWLNNHPPFTNRQELPATYTALQSIFTQHKETT